MKNIIFMLILSIYICIGQDILNPDPVIGDINGLSNRTNNELQGIRRGWNWENELKYLDHALKIQYNHYSMGQWDISENVHKFGNNMNFIPRITPITNNDFRPSLTQAQAIQFEPALDVSSGEFVPLPNDNTGAVFGFSEVSSLLFSGERVR